MEELNNELKCQYHQRLAYHLKIKLQQDSPHYLLCDKCVNKFQLRENLISLLDVRDCNESSLIDNWPQGLDDSSFEFINNSASINFQKNLSDKLSEFQVTLIQDISLKIKDIFIKQFDLLQEKVPESNLIQQYHSLFQTDQLITNIHKFDEYKYESFLNEFEKIRKERILQFNQTIGQIKYYQNLFQKLEINKQIILDFLQEILFLDDNDNKNNEEIHNDRIELVQDNLKKQDNEYFSKIKEMNQSRKEKKMANYIFKLLEKKREIDGTGFDKSMTKQFFDLNFKNLNEQYNIEEMIEVFQTFPIVDLCTKKLSEFPQNIINLIELKKTSLNNGQNRIVILKNNLNQFETYISVQQQQLYGHNHYTNCVSNLVLSKNSKYVFRIKIKSEGGNPLLGLMSSAYSNDQQGYLEKLSFHLKYENGILFQGDDEGISQKIKGDRINLPNDVTLEMRVWQDGKLLQVLDYPNYKCVVALKDQYKEQLKQKEDLKLYLSFYGAKVKYTLKEAFIVDKFEDV